MDHERKLWGKKVVMVHNERGFFKAIKETGRNCEDSPNEDWLAAAKNMSVMGKNNSNDANNTCWLAIKLHLLFLFCFTFTHQRCVHWFPRCIQSTLLS